MTALADITGRDGGRVTRAAEVKAVNADKRTVELSFSSEVPVQRWFGFEVLSHDPAAVDLTRMRAGAPLLMDHEWDDQIGVVESVSLDADRRGRAVVRFGKSARAEEIFRDVQDKIRTNVSVGYSVKDAKKTGTRDGEDVWTVTAWEPYEISIVSVPADISVGIGRKLGADQTGAVDKTDINTKDTRNMADNATNTEADAAETQAPPASAGTRAAVVSDTRAADAERTRSRSILEMGDKYGAADLASKAVRDGTSVQDFQRALLDHVNGKIQRPLAEQTRDADIGLTDREARNFSFLRVVRALSDPTNRRAQDDAAFEFEASRAAADKRGKATERFVVPSDVLTRALNTSTSGAASGDTGGFGIATTLQAQSFIDILRNRTTIMQLGSSMGGLVGNIDIPRQTAAATGYWVGEDDDASETGPDLGQISMSPKTVAAYSEITRKLLVQSSLDVEALVRFDLAKALALTIDKAGYYGTGSEQQPLGIANHTGINAVDFAGTQPTYAELVEMETQIALDNADVPGMGYVSNAAFRGHAKTTLKFPAAAIAQGGTIWEPGDTVNGYKAQTTNQITTGDVFFGNFADLLIGMWSGLELLVDPYSNSKKGRLRIVVFQDVDFALRRVQSFCLGRKP